jgi:hypothetical protein
MIALLVPLVVTALFQPPTSSGALDTIDRDVRAGVYGNVDRLLVIRKGAIVIDARYPRDYREISRGRRGPIGCGQDCADPAWMHEFKWWITSPHEIDVWAGRGFGGQMLYVIPLRDTVAVVHAWNVFGTPARGIGAPLLEALNADR